MTAEKNPGRNDGNSGRSRRTPGCFCERTKRLGFGFVESGGGFEYQKPQNLGVLTSFFPKISRVYWYTLVVYRYTLATNTFFIGCTGTLGGYTGTL